MEERRVSDVVTEVKTSEASKQIGQADQTSWDGFMEQVCNMLPRDERESKLT